MADDENRFGEIIAKCWLDESFKKRFMTEPKKVLGEFGMDVPEGLNVKVVENTDDTMYLTLPPRPPRRNEKGELSDNQLDAVSGGANTIQKAPSIRVNPAVVKLQTIKLATSAAQNTCSGGKECAPW